MFLKSVGFKWLLPTSICLEQRSRCNLKGHFLFSSKTNFDTLIPLHILIPLQDLPAVSFSKCIFSLQNQHSSPKYSQKMFPKYSLLWNQYPQRSNTCESLPGFQCVTRLWGGGFHKSPFHVIRSDLINHPFMLFDPKETILECIAFC